MERRRGALPVTVLTLSYQELKAFFATHANDEIGWRR